MAKVQRVGKECHEEGPPAGHNCPVSNPHWEGGPRCGMSESVGRIEGRGGARLRLAAGSLARVGSLLTVRGLPSLSFVWVPR